MNDFVTIDFILSFPGMVLISSLVVQVTKKITTNLFDKTKMEHHTYMLVFFVAAVLVALRTWITYTGLDQKDAITLVSYILLWLVNTLVVALASMKSFEAIKNNSFVTPTIDKKPDTQSMINT